MRLRATLEANELPHIEDVTNADPRLTPRNAIRESLRKEKGGMEYPTFIRTPLAQQIINNFTSLTRVRDEIDQRVDAYISANRIPSPPSTLAVKTALPPGDVDVRHAILLRILRYVSPRPWGSLDAEAGRREASLSRMEPMVWPPVITLLHTVGIAKRLYFLGDRGRSERINGWRIRTLEKDFTCKER